MAITIDQARQVKQKAGDIARSAAAVTGVGLTRIGDSYAIKINLGAPSAGNLPKQCDGVPIFYEVTGVARKQGL